jgi:hypothetical protein
MGEFCVLFVFDAGRIEICLSHGDVLLPAMDH